MDLLNILGLNDVESDLKRQCLTKDFSYLFGDNEINGL